MECHLSHVDGVLAVPLGNVFDLWLFSQQHVPAFCHFLPSAQLKVLALAVLFTGIVTAV